MDNKIIAVVKFNSGEAFVMEKPIKLEYTKYGHDTIIGTDGCFISCYGYQKDQYCKAFAGREFDLNLIDGTIEHCNGQWWDSITDKAKEVINDKMICVTANHKDRLKQCYVFHGYTGIEKQIDYLRSQYKGKVYDYWEYEKVLKNNE